jgi:hypothetical protein
MFETVVIADGAAICGWKTELAGRQGLFSRLSRNTKKDDPGPALTPGRPRRLSIDVLPTSVESGQTYTVDPKTGRVLLMRKMSERPATPLVRFMLNVFTDTRRESR